jgi:transposase-like protein
MNRTATRRTNRTATTPTRVSADALALRILLDGNLTEKARDAKLKKLARAASDAVHGRVECPACGSKSEKEHNGDRYDPTWLCIDCGEQFDDTTAA